MPGSELVYRRAWTRIKEEAAAVLAAMGLTVSDAVRLLLTRVARDKTLPFAPLVPNAKTTVEMREARTGNLQQFDDVQTLLDDLNPTIERTRRFKRDCKRESRGRHRTNLDDPPAALVHALTTDAELEPHHPDHAPGGPRPVFRDCRVEPGLVLIYQKPDSATLRPIHIGSHAKLGL